MCPVISIPHTTPATGRWRCHGLVTILALASTVPAAARDIAALPVEPDREQALLEQVGDHFKIRRTGHFVIAYDVPESVARELTARVERTYMSVTRFCRVAGITARPLTRRLEALFFNEPADYIRYCRSLRFRSEGTFGVYSQATNRAAYLNVRNDPRMQGLHADIHTARQTLDRLRKALEAIEGRQTPIELRYSDGRTVRMTKEDVAGQIEDTAQRLDTLQARQYRYEDHVNRSVIQHETAHQALFNLGVHTRGRWNPLWIVEGLACLFETPPSTSGAGIGAVNAIRLLDFREAVNPADPRGRLRPEDILDAIADGRLTAPAELIDRPNLLGQRGRKGTTHYAVAWALTHYLHRAQTAELAAYLRAVARRQIDEPPSRAESRALFEAHFGTLDERFLRRWAWYMARLPVRTPGRR